MHHCKMPDCTNAVSEIDFFENDGLCNECEETVSGIIIDNPDVLASKIIEIFMGLNGPHKAAVIKFVDTLRVIESVQAKIESEIREGRRQEAEEEKFADMLY